MRVLIVHNQLWAHYKSKLFNTLHQLADGYNIKIHVAQIALSEKSRSNMGDAQESTYDYPYEVLFQTSLDKVSFKARTKALLKQFNKFKPEVVNITGYYDFAQLILLFYAKLKGAKVIISNESNVLDNERNILKESFKKFILRQADGFFCFGKSSAQYLLNLGVASSKILTQKGAIVDDKVLLQHYHKSLEIREILKNQKKYCRYNFIYVGRFIEPKNLPMLIEAFAKIKIEFSEWGLILLGEGMQKEDLQKLVAQKNLADVFFEDGVAWYQVAEYLALADVLVLPSISEPWGLVVNEAMVCGLPVLVSDKCGCVQDLVKVGVNGLLFDPTQVADLISKMLYFSQNASKLQHMGDASIEIVAQFNPENVAHQMLQGIKNMIR